MNQVQLLQLSHQTMFVELTSRCMDAAFDQDFPENGSFVKKAVKGKGYWYYQKRLSNTGNGPVKSYKYVGPEDDPDIAARVQAFGQVKSSYRGRREMVQSLVAVGLPRPTALVGDIAELFWKAWLFRLRGVLVGTLAFQTYAGFLGVKLPNASIMTSDADFAQFHSISWAVADEMEPILPMLQKLDATFAAVPHRSDRASFTMFRNADNFAVEFLTPNRGSDAYQDKPARMPALADVSAEPLRFLDFLIYQPVRSVLLHKAGIPVSVPSPERYAVHKLIVSEQRQKTDPNGRQKAQKDLMQAGLLFQALALTSRTLDIGFAWTEAWGRGSAWQKALDTGRRALSAEAATILRQAVTEFCREEGGVVADYGFDRDKALV
jgi:hypothetical protein